MLRLAPLVALAEAGHRYCPPKSFLQVARSGPSPTVFIPYDGYFEVGCFIDDTPEDRWIKYHEVKAKANEQPEKVTPNLCFNFCRGQEGTKFFGLYEGTKCYCTKYPTLSAGGGGQGACTSPCAGDNTFMCGDVKGKHSIYSMHRCGDVNAVATEVNNEAKADISEATTLVDAANKTVDAVTTLALKVNITANRELIMAELRKVNGLLTDAGHRRDDCQNASTTLEGLTANGETTSAEQMDKLEQAEAAVQATAGALKDSFTSLQSYWAEHYLTQALVNSGNDVVEATKTDSLTNMDWKRLPLADEKKFGDKVTAYFSAGDSITMLFNSIDHPNFEVLKHKCYKACLVTPKCVAGNLFADSNGVGTCNLKSSVTKVQLSDDPIEGEMTGFIFNTYFNLYKDKIEFNTANIV